MASVGLAAPTSPVIFPKVPPGSPQTGSPLAPLHLEDSKRWGSLSFSPASKKEQNFFGNFGNGYGRSDFGLVTLAAEEEEADVQDGSAQSFRWRRKRNCLEDLKDGKYKDWGLHLWGGTHLTTTWESPMLPSGSTEFGVYWDVLTKGDDLLNFIVHKGNIEDNMGSVSHEQKQMSSLWLVSESRTLFFEKPDLNMLPQGNLGLSRAYWLSKSLLAWDINTDDAQVYLHASKDASLNITGKGIEGADMIVRLDKNLTPLPPSFLEKFPYVTGYSTFSMPRFCDAKQLVKCQLALAAVNGKGTPIDATGMQLPGVLDDLYAYNGPLGTILNENSVSLYLWAPSAQNVRIFLYSTPSGGEPKEILDMEEGDRVWSVSGPKDWIGMYYLFEVTVYHPLTGRIETSLANDPYSRGLSANGERSLIIDLEDPAYFPDGWTNLSEIKPELESFNDIAIYELHVRDFSAFDTSIHPDKRGTYLAFAEKDSAGISHLKKLSEAGITHVHLLPTFDFGTVNERKEAWKTVDYEKLKIAAANSEEQQAAVVAVQDEDGFNWGYDPVNWGVPDGSYATNPDGPCRTLEFRKMVQGLNKIGMRVVLDVVYNHVHGSGPTGSHSVLDKVVPGYYLRCNRDGIVENSTCANNTASEHYMMERLIVDDLQHWARNYKVDGFRFDLMGHLMKRTMLWAKKALRSLTEENSGVDGSKLYLYGEGWDFGEVSNNARGVNASQINLSGTGIGTFNDRLRDTAIGGSPFGDPLLQGFVTGLHLQPNDSNQGDEEATLKHLVSTTDWIRLALAGNLKNYEFINHEGKKVKGSEVLTHDGCPVGYASAPEEIVNYVSAHDNETLFDIIMMKAADEVSLDQRCRMNNLATSIVALGQGIPFFHAGDDMLRSKSLDRDSYNSGDWFNRLDFTYETNNWGVGLPPKDKNGSKWPIMEKLLENPSFKPEKHHILQSVANLQDLLKIRFSSPLFRLPTYQDVQDRLKFHNTGRESLPGLIIMGIRDGEKGKHGPLPIDYKYRQIVVLFNARPTSVMAKVMDLKGLALKLHPVQATSMDEIVKTSTYDAGSGTFHIPARTTTVFVEERAV